MFKSTKTINLKAWGTLVWDIFLIELAYILHSAYYFIEVISFIMIDSEIKIFHPVWLNIQRLYYS